ncbi:hypothetical protein SPRA44_260078 [Serratia proteamaculans]|nr:hypothetical protein SPRA44_260078 [Serratia proteamaculans]
MLDYRSAHPLNAIIKIAFNEKLLQRNDIGQRISLPMSWERQHEQHGFYY